MPLTRGRGGTGRRAGLRSLWEQSRDGSIPFVRTNFFFPIFLNINKSPDSENDCANINEAINENIPTDSGGFSFSFPVDPAQKIVKGSITVREEDGGATV